MAVEYPPRPSGTAEQQILQLWEYLYRLAERQNAETKSPADGAAERRTSR